MAKFLKQQSSNSEEVKKIVERISNKEATQNNHLVISNLNINQEFFNDLVKRKINSLKYLDFINCDFSDINLDYGDIESFKECSFKNCDFSNNKKFIIHDLISCNFEKCLFTNGELRSFLIKYCQFKLSEFNSFVITQYNEVFKLDFSNTKFSYCSFINKSTFKKCGFYDSQFLKCKPISFKDGRNDIFKDCEGDRVFTYNGTVDPNIEGLIIQSKEETIKQAVDKFKILTKQEIMNLNQDTSKEKIISEFIEWYNNEDGNDTTTESDWEISTSDFNSLEFSNKTIQEAYRVFKNENDVKDAYKELVVDFWNDVGFDLCNWDYAGEKTEFLTAAAKAEIFEMLEDDLYQRFDELTDEEKIEELENLHVPNPEKLSDNEKADEYVIETKIANDYSEDTAAQYWIDMLGEKEFDDLVVQKKNWVDTDRLADALADINDYGFISVYDGKEVNYKDLYIFRID